MIFNPEMTREAICGLEVSPEQLAEIDRDIGVIEESASPTLVSSTASSPRTLLAAAVVIAGCLLKVTTTETNQNGQPFIISNSHH